MFNFNNQNNENPKDILFSDSIQKRKEDEEENNKKSKLLNILGDKATPTDVLYGTSDKLEQKIKNLGLHKNEEVIAGAASSVNMTPIEELNAKKEDKNNMTPVEELYKRQKGYSPNSNYQPDNSIFTDDTIKKAREFIQGREEFKAQAYKPLKDDKWTIGYGHTKGVKPGDKITKEEAEKLYKEDFKEHSEALKSVKVPLTNNQKIALASFAYNMGATGFKNSDVVKILNTGNYEKAAKELLNYNKSKGKYSQGLYNRRKLEMELFLTPDD